MGGCLLVLSMNIDTLTHTHTHPFRNTSKKRCEENADSLSSLDLTAKEEKSEIHVFIERAVSRLKGRWPIH
jgi:hypothetical protein